MIDLRLLIIVRPSTRIFKSNSWESVKYQVKFNKYLRRQKKETDRWFWFHRLMKILIVIKKFRDLFVLVLNHLICKIYNDLPTSYVSNNINILTINPSPKSTRYKVPSIFHIVIWAHPILFCTSCPEDTSFWAFNCP